MEEHFDKLSNAVKDMEALCISTAKVTRSTYDKLMIEVAISFACLNAYDNEFIDKANIWMKRAKIASSVVKEKLERTVA